MQCLCLSKFEPVIYSSASEKVTEYWITIYLDKLSPCYRKESCNINLVGDSCILNCNQKPKTKFVLTNHEGGDTYLLLCVLFEYLMKI